MYIVIMASRFFVDWTWALEILWFTIGTILEMRGSTWGFYPRFVTWKKYIFIIHIKRVR
jgi:hypothetical protein